MLYKMNSSKICKTETSLFRSRFSVMFATTFASMIWFVVDWCLGTTFRSMSMWELWVNNLLVASVLMLPFVMSRRVWLQILWLFMVDIFMMANLMYSRTYFTAIPPDSYGLVSNLSGFTESVWYSLRWCGPCKMMHPILEELHTKVGDKARIITIDIDKNQRLAAIYNVRSVPTLMIFKNGKLEWRESGVQQVEKLEQILAQYY